MIDEQTKEKIYQEFYFQLKSEINFDNTFHIDFETKTNNSVFEFVSSFYAEIGEEYLSFDYDSPVEYKKPNIVCTLCNLVEIDEDNDIHYHTEEAEKIIQQAIENYR